MPKEDEYDDEGYGEEGDEEYDDGVSMEEVDKLIGNVRSLESKNADLNRVVSGLNTEKKDANFLHLQISTEEMLVKLENFYRGLRKTMVDGEIKWVAPQNKDLVTFNEHGVTSMMEIVSKYIDRNTILSDYREERIYEIIGDLGDDLTLFLLCNYQQMGMDTYFKKTKFRLIITTTLHIIESAYRRALRARTLEEVNQSKVVGQFGDNRGPMHSGAPPRRPSFMERMVNR